MVGITCQFPANMTSSRVTGSASDRSEPNSSPFQRPSYFDFSSTTGLHPPDHTFDEGVIKKLDLDDTSCSEGTGNMSADDERLKTFLRIRPSSLKKGGTEAISSLEIKDSQTVMAYTDRKHFMPGNSKKQFEFKFSKVLGPNCGQSTVYEECVNPVVQKFMRHENVLIFSYGATNSGKTYTMQGSGVDYGIIPRTLDAIFSRMSDKQYTAGNIRPHLYQAFHYLNPQEVDSLKEKRLKIISEANIKQELMNSYRLTASGFSDTSGSSVHMIGGENFSETSNFSNTTMYSLWVSYAELYNERVYDLLDNASIGKNKRRKELKLMHDRNGFVYIKDLTELPVTSDEQAYKLFLAGRKNLQFAATQMNQNSSRSHSFFTIRVVSIGVEGDVAYPKTVHRMTFCDLAGMERANQTENTGFRLQESGNINNSLTVLLKVIRVLREKQLNNNGGVLETIPFRESKLTHIFKSFFTSSTHICMMVNVNPHPIVAESTIQVLQNSAVASNVVVFRPLDLNQQSHPPEVHGNRPIAINVKQPLTSSHTKKETPSSSEKSASNNEESESDDDDYCIETVIAPKTMFQKLKILEAENVRLRRLVMKLEQENNIIREEALKGIERERRTWAKRLDDAVAIEKNFIQRRMSLQNQMSPRVVSCAKCSPSATTIDMEDIDETDEDAEETEGDSESGDENGDSDKEN